MDIFDSDFFVDRYLKEKKEDLKTTYISLDLIYPNPNQPRKSFDDEKIEALKNSIIKYGVISPIAIIDDMSGKYMIIAGERRYTAAKRAGLSEIPAVIIDTDMQGVDEISLIENIQREDLNVIEEALAYRKIMDKYSKTQGEIAEIVGKSRPYIANTLRLLNACDFVKEKLENGELSGGHAVSLLKIKDSEKQKQLAVKIIEESMSVRSVEKMVKKICEEQKSEKMKNKNASKKGSTIESLQLKNIEEELSSTLGTRVSIKKGKTKGSISIDFYSDDDLENLIDILKNR